MRAKFELDYSTGRDIDVSSTVIVNIKYDSDKRQFLESIARMLGVEVEVEETYAERVFGGTDEVKANTEG